MPPRASWRARLCGLLSTEDAVKKITSDPCTIWGLPDRGLLRTAQVATAVLGYLTPLLNARQPGLPAIAANQLSILKQALLATRVSGQWESLDTASLTARENVDAAIDATLETLSAVPDLLEVPPKH